MGIELLSIDLSNFCSKQCDFCYNHSTRKGNTMWTPSEVITFAEDCIANGIKAVSLGGGEPFEYKGIFEIIDDLFPKVYLSITSNGLPLLDKDIWNMLMLHSPDKIHVTIHQPDNDKEVERVLQQVEKLSKTKIKPGVNLLVSNEKIEKCKQIYTLLRTLLTPEQIILIPQRFSYTPTSVEMMMVTGGQPFQSPSCLLGCKRPMDFCSVSWDKQVNSCSFAGGKEPLKELTYHGMIEALKRVKFTSCLTSAKIRST